MAKRTAPNIEWDKINFDDTPGFRYPVTEEGLQERQKEKVLLSPLYTNEEVWNHLLHVSPSRSWEDLDSPHLHGSVYLRLKDKPGAVSDRDYRFIPRESILRVVHAGVTFEREGTSLTPPRIAPKFTSSRDDEAEIVRPCAIVHVIYQESRIKKYLFLSKTYNAQSTDLAKLLNHLVRMEHHSHVFTKNLISASL